ncbi:hypothetical protein AAV35_012760 [Salimicrobium jeotgali]|uniref:Putative DNA binding protein n=1 Tax=Salimicrobium jeotgali TaxID=1230341 RepID=K2GJ24_9BACI|nr:hypothetical protein [Salimicrobium jeotgali]AKG05534.1 hypothetical protein AAV35_012760 [Salimicrobium jeotgali]EKE30474.1 putative DNA binding protein [Salimicrobium jeotgali]MBM7696622.1 DNA-directed RNA polymerase specialized sigma subunit [Salimicrobium jeotgali]
MNKKQIEDALRDYNWMLNEIKRQRHLLEDAGTGLTTMYGEEAAMPKAQGESSDPVAREVVRRDKKHTWINRLEKKVLFVQERMSIIEDEREKAVLECLLDGMSMRAIGNHMGLSERHIFRIKNSIVKQMAEMSYLSGSLQA